MTWPAGGGREFRGVYDRWSRQFLHFEKIEAGSQRAVMQVAGAQDRSLHDEPGISAHHRLLEELALLETAGNGFDRASFQAGSLTPVFFGSALTNFGVEPFLQRILELAPAPGRRRTSDGGMVVPDEPHVSAFVFKIQANMDAHHRDRVGFLRICSGRMSPHMDLRITRTGEPIRIGRPLQFFARERTPFKGAVSGDVVGLWDSGRLRVGDTLCEGAPFAYRMKHEYGVDIAFEPVAFGCARWACGEIPRAHWFDRYGGVRRLTDAQRHPGLLLESEWAAHRPVLRQIASLLTARLIRSLAQCIRSTCSASPNS